MKPFQTLAQTRLAAGDQLTLQEHEGDYYMKLNGRQLMSSRSTSSERQLAEIACESLSGQPEARILIGGLGFGFTLQRVLEVVGVDATIDVTELIPEVVNWNREFLRHLNGTLLDDPRVTITVGDVFHHLRSGNEARYDAILLDVDNGPVAMVQGDNSRLYDSQGFKRIARALRPGGRVAVWSASEDRAFVERLSNAGFKVEAFAAKAHDRAKQAIHRIYVGQYIRKRPERNRTSAPFRGRK